MSATQKGFAVVWSIGTVSFVGGVTTMMPQSLRFSRSSEKTEIKDTDGIIRTQIFHGKKRSVSMTVIPYHASSTTSAQAMMETGMPAMGTTITMTDSYGTMMDANFNLISATQNRTVDGVATLDFELEQGDESNDLTTAVS